MLLGILFSFDLQFFVVTHAHTVLAMFVVNLGYPVAISITDPFVINTNSVCYSVNIVRT